MTGAATTSLEVVLETGHSAGCRAASEWAGEAWIAAGWITRDNSGELWLALQCNDPLCRGGGLISQRSILLLATAQLAEAKPLRKAPPDAIEHRDRMRARAVKAAAAI